MGKFDADGIVEPLEYNFRPYVAKSGTIKEPTDPQIIAFGHSMIREQQRIRKTVPDIPDDATPDEYLAALEKSAGEAESMVAMRNEAEIYATMCSGKPTADDLMKLPRRVRELFYSWLRDEVMNPEAKAGGGTAQVHTLRSAAAG